MGEPRGQRPMTIAELARRFDVAHSTVSRALDACRDHPNPAQRSPAPVDVGAGGEDEDREYYRLEEFAAWWPNRPRRGRPRATPPTESTKEG